MKQNKFNKIKNYYRYAQKYIDSAPLRQRLLLFLFVTFLLVVFWYLLFFSPIQKRNRNLSARLTRLQDQVKVLEKTTEATQKKADLMAQAARNRHKEIYNKLDAVAKEVEKYSGKLIIPQGILLHLQDEITKTPGVSLISIQHLPDIRLTGGARSQGLSLKGVVLTFRANYFDTIIFLQKLERSQWRFFWTGFTYVVKEYPMGEASLKLRALTRNS